VLQLSYKIKRKKKGIFMKNKNNKWTFAILAFIIFACTLISGASIITGFLDDNPGHLVMLTIGTLGYYFPIFVFLEALLYTIKSMLLNLMISLLSLRKMRKILTLFPLLNR
jgi:hypothetical protein